MPFAEGLCVFLCIFLSVIGDAEGVITSPPLNAVAEVDGEAVFNCSASTAPYAWTLTRDGMATIDEIAITSGCIVTTGLGNHYRTEQPGGPTTCSLIVFDVTMEQAGVYHCVHSDTFRALLTVIDSSSTLTSNNTPDVIETETVVLTCSVNYNGSVSPASTLRPHYYWTDVNGQNVSGFVDKSTENKAVSELSVKAGREDITPFTCHAYLKLDPPFNETGSYAKNTPSVNNNASSTPIVVLYPPIISNISSERRNATSVSCEFNTFSCDATANPVANFTWIDVEEPDRVTYGQSLGYAEFGRNYSCRATNIIRGKHNTDEETHKRNDYDSAIPSCKGCRNSAMNITGPTCTGTTCSCMLNCDMTVICTSDAFPEPMYQWMGNGEITASNNNTLDAVADGTYTCVAKNVIDGHEFEGRIEIKVENCSQMCGFTNEIYYTTDEMQTTKFSGNETTTPPDGNDSLIIIAGVIGVYVIANLISMIFFLFYYNIDTDRNTNENNRNVSTHKKALNIRFPWLEKMLPCLNQSHDSTSSSTNEDSSAHQRRRCR